MDRKLQERLVGALVLVILAVIVIPELLSGSGDEGDRNAVADGKDQAALKTYTIDFSKQRAAGSEELGGAPAAAENAQEKETSGIELPAPAMSARAEAPAVTEPAQAPRAVPTPAPQAAPPVTKAAGKPAPEPERAPAAKTPAVPSGAWAAQAGSFSSKGSADRLAADLKRRGYASFVTPYRSGGKTLHRVRIGPVATREAAEALVAQLKRDGTSANVVANP